MRRRRRAPTTQLARAGERTRLLIADEAVPEVRFRASTLSDSLEGTIEIETEDGRRIQHLTDDNRIDATGLRELSLVPRQDTAITFVPAADRPFGPGVVLGALFLVGALAWTAWEFVSSG